MLLHNIFWSHYKAGVFSVLSKELQKSQIDFKVIHFAETEIARKKMHPPNANLHQYDYQVLAKSYVEEWKTMELFLALRRIIRLEKPSLLILPGINNPSILLLTLYSRFIGVPIFNSIDSTKYDRHRSSLKQQFKALLLKAYHGIFCYGTMHKQYLKSLGVKDSKIHIRCQASPNIFKEDQIPYTEKTIDYLYVGRISEEKNLDNTLETFVRWNQNSNFYIVGDGPLKYQLEAKYKSEKVIFSGNKSLEELSWYYNRSKFLILPSISETWGLVVNEAMMHGLPILVSKHCGCSIDLVQNNGFIFNPLEEISLIQCLDKSKELSELDYKNMSNISKNIIKSYTPEKSAKQMALPIINKIMNK